MLIAVSCLSPVRTHTWISALINAAIVSGTCTKKGTSSASPHYKTKVFQLPWKPVTNTSYSSMVLVSFSHNSLYFIMIGLLYVQVCMHVCVSHPTPYWGAILTPSCLPLMPIKKYNSSGFYPYTVLNYSEGISIKSLYI